MGKMTTQIIAVIMLIPFGIFIVNGIRAGIIYTLHLAEEPFYILAGGSPFFFYLLEAVTIAIITLFLLWLWRHNWKKTNRGLIPIFFVGVIGTVFTGAIISGLSNLNGLQYRDKECGAYLSSGFNAAVEKQDISFCFSPHDYTQVNTYEGSKGGDYCTLPGGNTIRIVRSHSNEFDPIFSAHCFEALAVQTKQPGFCLETKSSSRSPDVRDGVVDCIENYARRDKDIASCELLTRDERNHCIFSTALWGTKSIKTCEAIDTDSKWKKNCLERMADGKP